MFWVSSLVMGGREQEFPEHAEFLFMICEYIKYMIFKMYFK